MEGSSHNDEYCGFDDLPLEMHWVIFDFLDAPDLKSCRLVHPYWNSVLAIGRKRILSKGMCTVYKARNVNFSCWEFLKRFLLGQNQDRPFLLQCNFLRITEVMLTDCPQLNNWINYYELKIITCVELLECEIDVPTVVNILKLKNLQELSLLDVDCLGLATEYGFEDFRNASNIAEIQKSLKKLRLREFNFYASKRLLPSKYKFHLLFNALAAGTKDLESLKIECFDTGLCNVDSEWALVELIRCVFIFWSRNSATLKEFTMNTYDVENCRRFNYINKQSWDLPRDSFNSYFRIFTDKFQPSQENPPELPNLEKLLLRFRYIPYVDNKFRTWVLPWIMRMKKLKELHLSQIYRVSFPPNFPNNFPQNSHCVLETMSRLSPSFTQTNGPTLRNELDRIKNKMDLLGEPNPIYILDPPPNGVIGHRDSTVQIKTDGTDWTFLYAEFQSLAQVGFYTQNLLTLKEIRIQQCGVYEATKIKITDEDFGSIFRNSLGLTHLEFEFCNLSEVSDSGLTGISPAACARMLTEKNYQVHDADIVGPSLSRLNDLRVLKLSSVGTGVTDVTAYYIRTSFTNISLVGEIRGKHKMSYDGTRLLKNFPKFSSHP